MAVIGAVPCGAMDDRVLPFSASFTEESDGTPVLTTVGDLDAATSPELVSAVEALRPLRGLTIDTSKLSFVDSAGLRALLAVREMVDADASAPTRLRHVNDELRRLLEICGLADAFDEVA